MTYKSPLHVECIEVRQLAYSINFSLKCRFGLTKHCGSQQVIPVLATNQLHRPNKDFSTLLNRC